MTSSLDPAPPNQPAPEPPTRIGYVTDPETGRILVYAGTIRTSDGRLPVWLPEGVTPEEIGVEVEVET